MRCLTSRWISVRSSPHFGQWEAVRLSQKTIANSGLRRVCPWVCDLERARDVHLPVHVGVRRRGRHQRALERRCARDRLAGGAAAAVGQGRACTAWPRSIRRGCRPTPHEVVVAGRGRPGRPRAAARLAPLGEVVATTRTGKSEWRRLRRVDLADSTLAPLLDAGVPMSSSTPRPTPRSTVPRTSRGRRPRQRRSPRRARRRCAARDRARALLDRLCLRRCRAGARTARTTRPAPSASTAPASSPAKHAIARSGARHLILRTAWVYALHGANFLRTMLRVGEERDDLRVVADQRGAPTPAWLIADDRHLLREGFPNPAPSISPPAARPPGTASPRPSSKRRCRRN